jgi:hypothetical protein
MTQGDSARKPFVDSLTVVAIAALAISLTVAFHEGVHAIACLAVGGNLQEYSALYESCDSSTLLQAKIVAGSAPTYNLIAGVLLWIILRNFRRQSSETRFFLWLFMLMNWFYGAGYFMFSGIANVGDWAVVINGWEPSWLWRVLMTIVGALLFMFFVRLGLKEFGEIVGGSSDEQMCRANKLWILSYFTAFVVVLIAGLFCSYGFVSLPVIAGLAAVAGALSPFLWMIRWFRTDHFVKLTHDPLEIHRKWRWIVTAIVVVFVYVYILGQTVYF